MIDLSWRDWTSTTVPDGIGSRLIAVDRRHVAARDDELVLRWIFPSEAFVVVPVDGPGDFLRVVGGAKIVPHGRGREAYCAFAFEQMRASTDPRGRSARGSSLSLLFHFFAFAAYGGQFGLFRSCLFFGALGAFPFCLDMFIGVQLLFDLLRFGFAAASQGREGAEGEQEAQASIEWHCAGDQYGTRAAVVKLRLPKGPPREQFALSFAP